MVSRLYIIAGTLFIIWIVEYFGYKAGQDVHILLLLSIIFVLVKAFVIAPDKVPTVSIEKSNK